ncbi:DUF309 domain-containing protein [Hydrogenimonas sp.]
MKAAYREFIRLIEAGRYYEAHEVLEELWYPRRFEKEAEVLLIKGYINASTAFELARRGRLEAAHRTWGVYLKYRPLSKEMDPKEAAACREVEDLLQRTHERLLGDFPCSRTD